MSDTFDQPHDRTFFVRIGGYTIKDGEAALIWNKHGESKVVVGPRRLFLWSSTVRCLNRFKAESQQYLQVKYRNGTAEHIPGPVSMYMNPILHDSIKTIDGLVLPTEDDCIVVTTVKSPRQCCLDHSPDDDKVVPSGGRRVVYGPTLYFPTPEETIHTFHWNGITHDDFQPTFKVLSMSAPRQVHFHLVFQTAEHHEVPVQLVLTFKVDSVEKCLSVRNPFQMIEPAIRHDVQMSKHKQADLTVEWLGKESMYPSLCETMMALGMRILKIQVQKIHPSFEAKQELMRNKRLLQRNCMMDQEMKAEEGKYAAKVKYYRGLRDIGVNVTAVLASGGKDPH